MDTDHIDLHSLFKSIMEKRWLILITMLSIFTCAILYALLQPAEYQTSILLKINRKQPNVLGIANYLNTQPNLTNLQEDSLAVKMALIQSEFTLKPVIRALGLDVHIMPVKSFLMDFFHRKPPIIHIEKLEVASPYLDKPLQLIIDDNKHYRLYDSHNNLLLQGTEGRLAINKNLAAIDINKIDAPKGSHFIVKKNQENDILKKIRSNLVITDLSNSTDNIENKAALVRLSLIGRDPIMTTHILNQIAKVTEQQDIQLKILDAKKTLAFLNQELPLIKSSLQEAEAKLNAYRSKYGRIDIKFQTDTLINHLSEINKQLEENQLKKIELSQKYTNNHPFIIAINQQINALQKSHEDLTYQLKKFPASEQEGLDLKREVMVRNNLYMILLNQIHQLQAMQVSMMSDIEVLSYPSIPYVLRPLKLSVIAIFGLLIGFLLGCLIALVWQIFSGKRVAASIHAVNPATLEVVSQNVN